MPGYIHSTFAGGMSDGPGIRFVVFFAGCPLVCKYCHNPDTWSMRGATKKTVDELIADALKYRSYYKFSQGGITASGGEPLLQPEFLLEFAHAAKNAKISFALDTSGYDHYNLADKILPLCDVVLLDIKSINPTTYENITGKPIQKSLAFLDKTRERGTEVWVRFTLVPGLNCDESDIIKMGAYLRQYPNIKKVDVSPFHKTGEYKWRELGLDYELWDTKPPTKEQLSFAQGALSPQV